jgi:ketosteroid isomerase-like protein
MNRWFAVVFLVVLGACSTKKAPPKSTVDEKIALIKTDKLFSDMSVAEGMKAAFIEYIDSNGVLLKPNHLPIVGANAIDYLIAQEDTGFTLNWQPQNGFVSESGDLGYTYGVYALHPKNMDTVIYGTYVSIWKKQADGSWKFVLDTGNQGIDSTEIAF